MTDERDLSVTGAVTGHALPAAPVPEDANLRGLEWMPLDVVTLPDTDLWVKSTGDEAKAAITLWCKAWRQIPAGSLPDDDELLADLSKAKNWKRLRREIVLRGWALHADGRLYHPIITQKVLEALPAREAYQEKRTGEADRKQRERDDRRKMFDQLRERGIHLPWNTKTGELRERIAQLGAPGEQPLAPAQPVTHLSRTTSRDTSRLREGQGEGQGQSSIDSGGVPAALAPAAKRKAKAAKDPGPTVAVWEAYSAAYATRYGVAPVRNAQVNGVLAQFVSRIPAGDAPELAGFYVTLNNPLYVRSHHAVQPMLRDAEGLYTQWRTGRTEPAAPISARAASAQQALAPLTRRNTVPDLEVADGTVTRLR